MSQSYRVKSTRCDGYDLTQADRDVHLASAVTTPRNDGPIALQSYRVTSTRRNGYHTPQADLFIRLAATVVPPRHHCACDNWPLERELSLPCGDRQRKRGRLNRQRKADQGKEGEADGEGDKSLEHRHRILGGTSESNVRHSDRNPTRWNRHGTELPITPTRADGGSVETAGATSPAAPVPRHRGRLGTVRHNLPS